MRVAAAILSLWAAWRWLGVLAGTVRVRRFEGRIRREARRTVVTRAALTVFVSVAAFYTWAVALRLQPVADLVGLLAALMMGSLAAGIVAALMQPAERTPETLDVCRLRRPPLPAA